LAGEAMKALGYLDWQRGTAGGYYKISTLQPSLDTCYVVWKSSTAMAAGNGSNQLQQLSRNIGSQFQFRTIEQP
jgi:hypothetical protein